MDIFGQQTVLPNFIAQCANSWAVTTDVNHYLQQNKQVNGLKHFTTADRIPHMSTLEI